MPFFAPAKYKEIYGKHEFDYLGKELVGVDYSKVIECDEDRANQIFRKQDQWAEVVMDGDGVWHTLHKSINIGSDDGLR